MRMYDFKKAKKIIEKNKDNLIRAALGMHEDWFWTSKTVWENGKYEHKLEDGYEIAGIRGSVWATPVLNLIFKDGLNKMIECFTGEMAEDHAKRRQACLSSLDKLPLSIQKTITPISKGEYNE